MKLTRATAALILRTALQVVAVATQTGRGSIRSDAAARQGLMPPMCAFFGDGSVDPGVHQ